MTTSDRAGREGLTFWTISAKKPSAFDHISGFTLSTGGKRGAKLDIRFERDTAKAMCFEDRAAAETVLGCMQIMMRAPLSTYQVTEHQP
jgi:hypothetical protein